jgi:hypothetical protein
MGLLPTHALQPHLWLLVLLRSIYVYLHTYVAPCAHRPAYPLHALWRQHHLLAKQAAAAAAVSGPCTPLLLFARVAQKLLYHWNCHAAYMWGASAGLGLLLCLLLPADATVTAAVLNPSVPPFHALHFLKRL